jgi:hypothetical protein
MSKDLMHPMDNESDSPSRVLGPIQLDVPRAVATGVAPADHPELANDHPDVRRATVADLAGESSVGHDANRVLGPMQAHAPEAFADSATLQPKLREKRT